MDNKTTPVSEVYVHTYKGTAIYVHIDYELGKVSLVDSEGRPRGAKKWVFADRELEYMAGWQNILDAMKDAITGATKKLEEYKREQDRKREEAALAILQATNKD